LQQRSDWQLSKLYIWDYHLSDSDFALVSSSLYTELTERAGVAVCEPCATGKYSASVGVHACTDCPASSNSPLGSTAVTDCICDAGYTGADGGTCTQCEAGKFKNASGTAACQACPARSKSLAGSTVAGACVCDEGHTFHTITRLCAPCRVGTYKSKDFLDLVRLQKPYIVSTANDWNATTGRFDSLCGVEACAGSTGVSDQTTLTVLALLPRNLAGPVFASKSTWDSTPLGSVALPTYNVNGGPTGNGDVRFDSTKLNFLDAGARTFKISANGGFTIIIVFKCTVDDFSGGRITHETLMDFGTNIRIRRDAGHRTFALTTPCWHEGPRFAVVVNGWNTLTATYRSADRFSRLTINGQATTLTCGSALRVLFDTTYLGIGSLWNGPGNHFTGNIAGMFFVDMVLEQTAIDAIVASMFAGEDVLRAGHPRVVAVGSVPGNGAAAPVAFVGGIATTRMQWGALSVPAAFTICSVTRYSGQTKQQILGCSSNPAGHANFVHGHLNNIAGATLYGDGQDATNMNPTTISPDTDWIVVCGRNTMTPNSVSVAVNEQTRTSAAGGVGSCALGMNHASQQQSDWQLSKLYIWDFHLSDSDFALASSSLYAALSTSPTDGMCLACPQGGCSPCSTGYTAQDGGTCTQCEVGKFKHVIGSASCSPCAPDTDSPAGSTNKTACRCNVGHTGPNGGPCTACPPGTFKAASGDSA